MSSKKKTPVFEIPLTEAIIQSIMIGDCTYVLQNVSQYETETDICIAIVKTNEDGRHSTNRESVTIAYSEQIIFVPFNIDGHQFFWDYRDNILRFHPDVDFAKRERVNQWFHIIDEDVLWVEKEYAENNLTPECLSYAYSDKEGNYCWSCLDYSHYPVLTELFQIWAEYSHMTDLYTIKEFIHNLLDRMTIFNLYYISSFDNDFIYEITSEKNAPMAKREFCIDVDKFYDHKMIETTNNLSDT